MSENLSFDFDATYRAEAAQQPPVLISAHTREQRRFDRDFFMPLLSHAEENLLLVKRSGGKLLVKPNCLRANDMFIQWKRNMSYYGHTWKQHLTVDELVTNGEIPGLENTGLKLHIEPDLFKAALHRQRFYNKEGLPLKEIPKALSAEYKRHRRTLRAIGYKDLLYPYQRHDAAVHALKNYSFLAYKQRLGKTRTAIATVILKETKINLFVCFSSLIETWTDEMEVMNIPKSDINVIRHPSDLYNLKKFNIIAFETLRREERNEGPIPCERCGEIVTSKICMAPNPDIYSATKTCGWNRYDNSSCPKCGAIKEFTGRHCNACDYSAFTWTPALYKRMKKSFDCIVVDESQASKNRNSQQGRALRALQAKHKIILTGTILENYISECFWQLWWLLGKGSPRFQYQYNGGYALFLERFCVYTKTKSGRNKLSPKIRNAELFYELMDTVMTRRTEKDPDVAKFINVPDIKNGKPSFISIEPTAPEKEIYDRAVDNFEIWYREQLADLDEMPDWMRGTSMKQLSSAVLVKLNILRRISSCPFLYDSYTGNGTAKMEFIKQIVKKKVDAGEKVLIASVNNPFVDKMIAAIPGAEGFTGKMSIKRRNEMRKRFQNEEYPKVLVVSTQACNLGVNMTSASTAIIVDLLWSPKKLEQMWKRIHGPGQTAECDIIYLINDGMIDEDINELLIGKDRGIDEAIDRIKDDSEVEYFSPIEFAEKMLNKRKGE